MPSEPYRDTSVPVSRSKQQIADVLRRAGARGLQLEEEWGTLPDPRFDEATIEVTSRLLVRFVWPTETGGALMRVRFDATPLPPEPAARTGWKVSPEQRERQAWRGLAWYIESLVKAATFGIVPFEAVFLAYFEDGQGRTIGEAMIPEIEAGRLALPKAAS